MEKIVTRIGLASSAEEMAAKTESTIKFYCGQGTYLVQEIGQIYYIPESEKYCQYVTFHLNDDNLNI